MKILHLSDIQEYHRRLRDLPEYLSWMMITQAFGFQMS